MKNTQMKKEFKRGGDKKSFKTKKKKNNSAPAFERYRDNARPSDFGNAKKDSASDSGSFREKRSINKKRDGDKVFHKGKEENEPKEFKKKLFSDKPGAYKKTKPEVNPYDLDEADLEYGKADVKEGTGGAYFKKKAYKKNYSNKGKSKPQRDVEDGMIRLNKYIANAGICSRREADDLISSGVVQVNGKTITEMGYRVKPTDVIKYGGQTLRKERLVYLILNKPKDYITTVDDPQKRRTVLELVKDACRERIYPVGRLDRATTGLLMFTNDGDLTKKMTHPRYGVRKIYHVELDKPLKHTDLSQITEGIELEDGLVKVDEITYVGDGRDKSQIGVELHSGKNRVVRRIFEHLGYNVRKLDRVMFGSLTKKDLPRGHWRFLTEAEVGMLKMISTK